MAKRSVCSIDGCINLSVARGWCSKHWQRWRDHGDPLHGKDRANHFATRGFIEKALSAGQRRRCIIWPFSKLPKGYGRIEWEGKGALVHRIVCKRAHGPAPTNRHVAAHSCGNASCCNPHHIRWATPKENSADQELHDTARKGADRAGAKLTEAQVIEMRAMKGGMSYPQIARRYGISPGHARDIVTGRFWKHIPLCQP